MSSNLPWSRRRSPLGAFAELFRHLRDTVAIRRGVARERRRERERPSAPQDFSEASFAPTAYVPAADRDERSASLTELADLFRTDKGTIRHLYTPTYERYLEAFRHRDDLALLEIGVASGASLRMWSAYFPRARVIGVDVKPECREVCAGEPRIEVRIADAAEGRQPEMFDVIVDDGSHLAGQIVRAYEANWPSLKPGGFYIIEDLACTHDRRYGIAALAVYRFPWTAGRLARRSTFSGWLEEELRKLDLGTSEWEFCHLYKELCIIRRRSAPAA